MAKKEDVKFPKTLYVSINDPDTEDEYRITGETPQEIWDVSDGNSLLKVARYVLAGIGEIKCVAPAYIEDAKA